MKCIGTFCFPSLEIKEILRSLNRSENYNNQYRIVCKARGINQANELTQKVGYKIFGFAHASVSGNKTELSYFKNNKDVNYIIEYDGGYITDIEINKILNERGNK